MHDRLVHDGVHQQVLDDLPYAEALQAGRIGLWRAIMRFDPSRGHAFSTYAWPSIVHYVWRAVKVHTRAWREEPIVARYGLDGQGSRVIYRRYSSLNPSLFYLPIRAGLLLRKPSVL
jgi:hypothetical protein